jgi:hypothetical protein
MADNIEGFMERRVVIGEVQGAPKYVKWRFNSRSSDDAESVMKNTTAQTGLSAKLEKRRINLLVVKKAE